MAATVTGLSHHDFASTGPITFVHFRYLVRCRSDAPLFLKVEKIALIVDGVRNTGAYYDSVASVVPHWRELEPGETVVNAYATFPGTLDPASVKRVEFGDRGFSRKPNELGVHW